MTVTKKVVSVKKDFDMNSTPACVFHHSQWESCVDGEHASIPYLIYRLVFMLILISSMLFSTLCQSYLFQIFLTNWSFTLQTLYAILSAFNIVWAKRDFLRLKLRYILKGKSASNPLANGNGKSYELNATDTKNSNGEVNINVDGNSPDDALTISTIATADENNEKCDHRNHNPNPNEVVIVNANNNHQNQSQRRSSYTHGTPSVLEKVIWALMNVSHVLPHIVALGYWIFVYKYDPKQPKCEAFRSHFIVHGALSILALIDALIIAIPARKSHFVFPSFVLLIYTIFSYIYELAGGPYRNGKEYIYSVLNWRYKPGKTALIITIGLILSPLVHFVLCWGMHHIRLKLVSWTNGKRNKK